MEKILKNPVFMFILGGLVFGSIGVYATLSLTAEDVTYGSGTVKSALDTLYTKAKPAYTGSTSVTPTTSSQTLNTANTILNSNITVGAIPSTYKNLSTTTTATASDILSGKTAYDNLGNLITGSISANCVTGTVPTSQRTFTPSDPYIMTTFKPKRFFVIEDDSAWKGINYYDESMNLQHFFWADIKDNPRGGYSTSFSSTYSISNDGLKLINWGSTVTDNDLYYVACR